MEFGSTTLKALGQKGRFPACVGHDACFAERALYTLECAFHPVFSLTNGTCRLDYRHPENRWVTTLETWREAAASWPVTVGCQAPLPRPCPWNDVLPLPVSLTEPSTWPSSSTCFSWRGEAAPGLPWRSASSF